MEIGLIGTIYILFRMAGKILGASIGSRLSGAGVKERLWIGAALFPQAGAATGMALVAIHHFPDYRQILLPVVIGSTVFFELLGPVFTRTALKRMAGS